LKVPDQLATDRLTSQEYWDHTWHPIRDTRGRGDAIRRLLNLQPEFGSFLLGCAERRFSGRPEPRILEVGCANSIWLPYVAGQLSAEAVGVDFSPEGCALARVNFEALGVPGRVVCDDYFSFATTSKDRFDFIMSFGFVEHFAQPGDVLGSMAGLLNEGGIVVATVPNLSGVYGLVQRIIDRDVFSSHVIVGEQQLRGYADGIGLDQVEVGYVGGAAGLRLLNFSHVRWLPQAVSRRAGSVLAEIDWFLARGLRRFGLMSDQSVTSPYLFLCGVRQ